ncbi:hypothetical protein F5B22DRAFT_657953 [Xylaria bambusicola]|uniref:uncharacterized protein n=1 Tax=Xylaria bambusicola TaxID=326684 RepID=UPI002007892E|nr:uncharacterized protein F5B22DRAFT_657953 [Xylaria bambusicola]KAI0509571.1 hypothetical protein F5B22DRAFT_657953 [Xylaria bambusicola]
MVRVKLPTQRFAGRAESAARHDSQESEDTDYTPRSTSQPSSDDYAIPRAEFRDRFDADMALPTVEGSFSGDGAYNISTPSTPSTRAPSLPLTPSRSASSNVSTPATIDRDDDDVNHLGSRLRGMRFSTARSQMNMAPMSSALQDVAAGLDNRSSPLLDPLRSSSFPPSPLRTQRRRSRSRSNVGKHNVNDEVPPNDRFNNPGFQKRYQDTKESVTKLVSVLSSSAVHNEPDSVMERLCNQAKDLSQFECPSRRTVGFVGDSGAGKSTLLNSLLDCHDLARSSNGGSACTCVVTEFHFHHDKKFAIEVETFSDAELMPQLRNLLEDYRHYHLNRDSFEPHELVELEKRADIARDTFQAMFPGVFIDKSSFIRDTEQGSLSTLTLWVQRFDRSMIPKRQSGLGLEECSSLLMQLSSDVPSNETSLWPWIKKIMVYSDAHILSKGLILVDLPGLRDLNTARRNITERYLLKCDEIFVVAAEGRATTDEGVKSVIELAKKAKLSDVSIICTRSDEINPTEALKDWKGTRPGKEVQEMLDVIKREKSINKNLSDEINSFDEFIDDINAEEAEELSRLERAKRSSDAKLRSAEFDLQRFLITTRNKAVEKKLTGQYKHEVPGNRLKVFCASNSIYWDWRQENRDQAMPHLELSGVLAIRLHCMAMVSESQYAASIKYMRDDIGVLLGELNLWVQSGQGSLSAERKEKVRSTLGTLERKLYLELCGRSSKLNIANSYKQEFDTKLYRLQGDRVNGWSVTAKHASNDWTGWHHASYAAFCRNFGTHHTAKVGSRNWNEEIIEQMVVDLSAPWEQLQFNLDIKRDDITEFIGDIFEEADTFLDAELNDSPETANSISSTLGALQRVLAADVENNLDDLQVNLRTLRADALSGIRTSFIGKAMENAYNNARLESGGGSDARRKAIINSAVRRHGLFTDLLKSFKRDFDEYVNDSQVQIQEIASSHFDAIRDAFNIVRNDNAALECEMDPEFRRRVEAQLRTTREEMRVITMPFCSN